MWISWKWYTNQSGLFLNSRIRFGNIVSGGVKDGANVKWKRTKIKKKISFFHVNRPAVLKIIKRPMIRKSVNNKSEKKWKEAAWPNWRNYPVIWLDGQRNTTKILCQYSRSPGQDFISRPGPAEFKYTANLATAGIPLDHRETPVRLSSDTKSYASIYKTICLRHVLCFTLHRF
jgi:hypothetical protein